MSEAETTQPVLKPVLNITDAARSFVAASREEEPGGEQLALYLEVSGAANGAFTYDMWFQAPGDAATGDSVQHHDDLSVIVLASSIDKIRGATLDVADQGGEPGLVILNPNAPPVEGVDATAPQAPPDADLTGPVAQRLIEVLEAEINPQIASHGGRADLVAVDEGTAYLRLSGGCQGCGLAAVTLSQGIAVAIKDAVPEITEIVDVTSHNEGTNPYFEAAKK